MQFFKANKFFIFFSVGVLLYAVGAFLLSTYMQPYERFQVSPDENVARVFTNYIHATGLATYALPDDIPNDIAQYTMPRSTRYQEASHSLSMSSYYGLPILYSVFESIISIRLLFVLVMLIGILSIYFVCRYLNISNWLINVCVLLFAFNPLYIYYGLRGYMHNVLFVVLLSVSIVTLLYSKRILTKILLISSGLLLGFASAVRTNEIVWVLVLYVVVYIIQSGSKIKQLMYSFIGFLIGFLPFVGISKSISGSVVQYDQVDAETISSQSFLVFLKELIFPFGISIGDAINRFVSFSAEILWVGICIALTFVLACYAFIRNRKKVHSWIVFISGMGIFFYQILYYGSYEADFDGEHVMIASSHYRYWLPVFLFSILLFVVFLSKIKIGRWGAVTVFFITIFLCITSLWWLFQSPGGVFDTRSQNILAKERFDYFSAYIVSDSIVLAGRADKYFFDDWYTAGTRMHTKRAEFVESLVNFSTKRTVHFYHVEADISSHFTKEALEDAGVNFEYVAKFFDGGNAWEYLYKLDWPNKENNGNE